MFSALVHIWQPCTAILHKIDAMVLEFLEKHPLCVLFYLFWDWKQILTCVFTFSLRKHKKEPIKGVFSRNLRTNVSILCKLAVHGCYICKCGKNLSPRKNFILMDFLRILTIFLCILAWKSIFFISHLKSKFMDLWCNHL